MLNYRIKKNVFVFRHNFWRKWESRLLGALIVCHLQNNVVLFYASNYFLRGGVTFYLNTGYLTQE